MLISSFDDPHLCGFSRAIGQRVQKSLVTTLELSGGQPRMKSLGMKLG